VNKDARLGSRDQNPTKGNDIMKVNLLLRPLEEDLPLSELLPEENFSMVHPVIKGLFPGKIPKRGLGGRLKFFLANWQKVTSLSY